MASVRLQRVAMVTAGVVGVGGAVYYWQMRNEPKILTPFGPRVHASWTTNFKPSTVWDYNWDHRDPKSLVKPSKGTPEDDNRYNEEIEENTPHSARHIFFIRHGQYNLKGKTDNEHYLTDLGRQQAEFTGKRLKELGITWDKMEKSTMTRAQETANLIAQQLGCEVPTRSCSMLEEGAPIPPEPPIGHWKPEPYQFFQEGARIEAAFRKHVHRAKPSQIKDSYTLVVCHANVIRYFVCRAMQFPPEAWLRISLNHASITWITVQANGRVTLRCLGDTGHMEPKYITSR